MLGALSLKWKWRHRREKAGKDTARPNLVFGGDVHVVWEKFCRYFDVEPRIIPLQPDKYTIGPDDVEPHVDENTIGVAAVLGTTFTGHADDISGINDLLVRLHEREGARRPAARRRRQRRLRVAVPLPPLRMGLPAGAGALDQRLRPQVRVGLPGDRLAHLPRVRRPAPGPRLRGELPRQDSTPRSRSTSRPARRWCSRSTTTSCASATTATATSWRRCRLNAQKLWPSAIADIGDFALIGDRARSSCRWSRSSSTANTTTTSSTSPAQLASERGWMVPAYTLPPDADHVKIMRALVKLTLGHSMVTTLADDIAAGVHDVAREGRPSRARAPEGEHQHRLLTVRAWGAA